MRLHHYIDEQGTVSISHKTSYDKLLPPESVIRRIDRFELLKQEVLEMPRSKIYVITMPACPQKNTKEAWQVYNARVFI